MTKRKASINAEDTRSIRTRSTSKDILPARFFAYSDRLDSQSTPSSSQAAQQVDPRKARLVRVDARTHDDPSSEEDEVGSHDELDALLSRSPSKQRSTPSKTSTPRLVLHSVEITTPSPRRSSRAKLRKIDMGSPTPTPRELTPRELVSSKQYLAPTQLRPPEKTMDVASLHASPNSSRLLPNHLHSSLMAQKHAILLALQNPPDGINKDLSNVEESQSTNAVALRQLNKLLDGTVSRGEGNSCLVIGPRGSGKTRIIERALARFPNQPVILRLSGYSQDNDRLAFREIIRQLAQQLNSPGDADNENFSFTGDEMNDSEQATSSPPSSHLPALISTLPSLSRPSIVVVDAFDLFAMHPRQALLYCLLDAAQGCRVGKKSQGMAVIGVTSRVDTINLLEKRVKSRFSGRTIRTACPKAVTDWIRISRAILRVEIDPPHPEWSNIWEPSVDNFLGEQEVISTLNETFGLTRDIRMLSRILTSVVLHLAPSQPFLRPSSLSSATAIQRFSSKLPFLTSLPYPSLCLLIAATHTQTTGHDVFTFEMLHELFRDQVRTSLSAPIQVEGGGIGMLRCSRGVLFGAFEDLVSRRTFVAVTSLNNTSREFVKYRSMLTREEVKHAVERVGQINLKKWLNKAQ